MVGPSMPDAEKVAAVREALPAVGAGIYLNAPVAGPLPAEGAAAMAQAAEWELRTGRAHRDRADEVGARVDEARASVAAILAADLDEVGLAHGAEDAFGRALRTVDWRPGDRLAILPDAATEPIAGAAPRGVEVVALERPEADLPARTRLVVVPLVGAGTGERMPVEAVAVAAHAAGAAVLVEASLGLGAVPVSLDGLGADLLVARAEAWLLGPEGLAIVAGGGVAGSTGGFHVPSVIGLARAAGWLSMYVGLPWVHARGAALTDHAEARLSGVPGVELLTPPARATTLAFRIAGWRAEDALEELGRRVFLLASALPELDAIRIGIGCWNTVDELDRLADAVELLAAHTPGTLPRRPRLAILGDP